MRSSLLCSVVAALAFGLIAPASAASSHAPTKTAATYSACQCRFGYVGDKGACMPSVTCLTEGGRCRASCGSVSEDQ
jgi:hypothetical protein